MFAKIYGTPNLKKVLFPKIYGTPNLRKNKNPRFSKNLPLQIAKINGKSVQKGRTHRFFRACGGLNKITLIILTKSITYSVFVVKIAAKRRNFFRVFLW